WQVVSLKPMSCGWPVCIGVQRWRQRPVSQQRRGCRYPASCGILGRFGGPVTERLALIEREQLPGLCPRGQICHRSALRSPGRREGGLNRCGTICLKPRGQLLLKLVVDNWVEMRGSDRPLVLQI